MKKTLFAFIILVAVLAAGNVTADPIDGTIGFYGTFTPTGGTGDLGDATGVTFPFDTWVTGASGDFASVGWGSTAIFSSFTFDPFGNPVTPLWRITGSDFSFDLNFIDVVQQDDLLLVLSGAGILHGGGDFDDTYGTWDFRGNSYNQMSFSFSTDASMSEPISTPSSIPDPSAMVLLGSACLVCFVGTRRKRG